MSINTPNTKERNGLVLNKYLSVGVEAISKMNNNCMNIYLMMNMKYILVLLLQYPNQFFKTI
jgi:hypothetical protein